MNTTSLRKLTSDIYRVSRKTNNPLSFIFLSILNNFTLMACFQFGEIREKFKKRMYKFFSKYFKILNSKSELASFKSNGATNAAFSLNPLCTINIEDS